MNIFSYKGDGFVCPECGSDNVKTDRRGECYDCGWEEITPEEQGIQDSGELRFIEYAYGIGD